jgi:Ead/Ea22-like protein
MDGDAVMDRIPQIPESPAETIRLAAALMRESAGKATPGLWQHMCLGSEGCLVLRKHGTIRERGQGRVARFGQKDWQADHADAAFVAAMNPVVALALADWLDREAALIDAQVFPQSDPAMEKYPLAVARAYLGEAS